MKKKIRSTKKHLTKQFKRTLDLKSNVAGYKPTPMVCNYWYRKLNTILFNNRLGPVMIEIKRLHNDWGRCVVDWDNRKTPKGKFNQRIIPYHIPCSYKIQLITKYPKWQDFIETLAHEMVHLYQMTVLKDPYSNHNANFYSFRSKFKSAGLKLCR